MGAVLVLDIFYGELNKVYDFQGQKSRKNPELAQYLHCGML
jgi:hypothetical protein